MAAQRCAKGAKVRGGYPLSAPFTPFCPGLHPSAGFAPFCQVCTLLPGLHPSARFAPFCQVCTLLHLFLACCTRLPGDRRIYSMTPKAQDETPWYRDGLAFRCTRCGNCCT